MADIIATIKKCPSGALTYIINGKHEKEWFKETRIVVEKDGPLHGQGDIELKDGQSSETFLPDADPLYTLPVRQVEKEATVRRIARKTRLSRLKSYARHPLPPSSIKRLC